MIEPTNYSPPPQEPSPEASVVPIQPTKRPRIDSLQAFRGFAAILVVFSHATDAYREFFRGTFLLEVFKNGWAGVDVFFVLSGFIIYYIHGRDLGKPSKAIDFVKKRTIRIYPLYWLVVIFKFGLQRFRPVGARFTGGDALMSATLWPIPEEKRLGRSWTLSHELLFYFIFGIGIVTSRLVLFALISMWTVTMLGAIFVDTSHVGLLLKTLLSFRNLGFVLGVVLAWKYVEISLSRPRLIAGGGSILFLFLYLCAGTIVPRPLSMFGFALSTMIILYGLLKEEAAGRLTIPKSIVYLGDASYSIYLGHTVVVTTIYSLLSGKFHVTAIPAPLMPLVPIAAILAGCFVYSTVERPLVSGLRRLLLPATQTA